MALVSTKCPNCGGDIQLDNEKKQGFCLYCGSPIDVKETLNPKSANITGSDEDVEKWEMAYENCCRIYDYMMATEIAVKILQAQPQNQEAIDRYKMIKTAQFLDVDEGGCLRGLKKGEYDGERRIFIPPGVTSIALNALLITRDKHGFEIEEITIPETVTSICWPISKDSTRISIPQSDTYLIDEKGLVFSKDQKKLYYCKPNLIISRDDILGIESIEKAAFKDNEILRIEIPPSVKSIGDQAFFRCKKLSEIEIPLGVESIGCQAFYRCRNLSSIKIPSSVKHIGDEAFYDCDKLIEVEIPLGVESIGDVAFSGCRSLSEVEIPLGVESIGDGTFSGCGSLSSIKIPSSVKRIGNKAFFNCNELSEVEIPLGVESIGDGAFSSCGSLSSIKIPSSVKRIGNKAFFYCNELSEVEIPLGVESIGDGTFYCCSNLSSIKIPSSVKRIGDEAFNQCTRLSEVEIPLGVESIGHRAFYECVRLSEVEIPLGVESIGDRAFYYCTSLSSIKIPSSVKRIGDEAFSRCIRLVDIEIPSSVVNIGRDAFNADFSVLEKREKKKIEKKRLSYWNEHASERDGLMKKKQETLAELNSLRFFEGKRKKQLTDLINEIEAEFNKDR